MLTGAMPTALGPEERELLVSASTRARTLDAELAGRLERRGPAGRAITGEFLQRLDARPRLPEKLELELVVRAKEGDPLARGRLIEAFLPLVAGTARNYRSSGSVEQLDLLQEGVLGLLRALDRYDPRRGTPFWAYASWWVRHSMQQLVAELTRPVVLSDRALRQLARLKDAYRRLTQARAAEPTVAELSEATGLSREQIHDLLAAERPARLLDEPPPGSDADVSPLYELIDDPFAEQAYEEVLLRLEVEELRSVLSGLSDRERAVVSARHGIDGPEQSLREIAAGLGVSAERVRQIEERAMAKLRAGAGV